MSAKVKAAGVLRQFIGKKVGQSKDEATYDARIAVARQQLRDLHGRSTTEADRKLTLTVALMLAKDHERQQLVFLANRGTDYSVVQQEIAELYEAREQCDQEVRGWLDQQRIDRATLEAGACLAEAQQAASALGI